MRRLTVIAHAIGELIERACRCLLLARLGIRVEAAKIKEHNLQKALFLIDDQLVEAEEAVQHWRREQAATEAAIDTAWQQHSRLWRELEAVRQSPTISHQQEITQ